MKTTIDIPEKELEDAMRFTRATTKREAVVTALKDTEAARSATNASKRMSSARAPSPSISRSPRG